MIELTRRVRFCVSQASPDAGSGPGRPAGAYAGWPGMIGVGAFYELEVTCRGEPDTATGYLMNISRIDAAVQAEAIPMIQDVFRRWPQRDPGRVLEAVYRALAPALDPMVVAVRWWLSPYYSVAIEAQAMDRVLISQQFEFSAAHRLHSPELDEAENRRTFGKCNNPSGHGHNYRLEPIVSMPLKATNDPDVFNVRVLERIVDEVRGRIKCMTFISEAKAARVFWNLERVLQCEYERISFTEHRRSAVHRDRATTFLRAAVFCHGPVIQLGGKVGGLPTMRAWRGDLRHRLRTPKRRH